MTLDLLVHQNDTGQIFIRDQIIDIGFRRDRILVPVDIGIDRKNKKRCGLLPQLLI